MTTFSDLGLAEPILRAVRDEGYDTPTPIQAKLIPIARDGQDVVGIAQTGTGKTAAFTLPTLHRLHTNKPMPVRRTPLVLILAPTRELVLQISACVRTYGRHIRPSLTEIVGGVKPGPQVKAMAPGVDILVATPGRLLDHMNAGAIQLKETSTLILDEADQMMDMGFIPAIRRIISGMPKSRQTILLSATMPKAIRALANDFLTNPVEVAVAPQARPVELITQRVIHTPGEGKRQLLIDALSDVTVDRAIVFTRTKRGADRVAKTLAAAGIAADAIHGNKSQGQRNRALEQFKRGQIKALVATDVASRGIDIDDVTHVINYELPNIAESYVHRIGRTARAGRSGVAISFCEGEERGWLRDIEKLIGTQIPASGTLQTEVAPPVPGKGRQQPAAKKGPPKHMARPKNASFDPLDDKPWASPRKDKPAAVAGSGAAKRSPAKQSAPRPIRFEDGAAPRADTSKNAHPARKPTGPRRRTGPSGAPRARSSA